MVWVKLTSIESMMPSSHLILCHPILFLPPIPPTGYLGAKSALGGLEQVTLQSVPQSLHLETGEAEIPGVSREVPCSVLKCETVLDTLDATPKVP